MVPCVFHVAFLGPAHPVLDLGEGLFDGIEVGAVGRQEPEPGAGGFDGVADGLGFVTSQVVHDDDVPRLQGSDELLFHVGEEAGAIDRAIEDAGRSELVTPKCRQERHGAPVPVRREARQALAFWPPAPEWRHVRLDPGLIDEHQALGINPGLPSPPTPPPMGDGGAASLKGEQRFF